MSFGGEINCLAKMHVGNADCMKSFDNVTSVLTECMLAIEKICNIHL